MRTIIIKKNQKAERNKEKERGQKFIQWNTDNAFLFVLSAQFRKNYLFSFGIFVIYKIYIFCAVMQLSFLNKN